MSAPNTTPPAPVQPTPSPQQKPGVMDAVSNLFGGVGKVVAAVPDAVNTEATDTATVKKAPTETGVEATGLAKGIPSYTQGAQEGVQTAAEKEQAIATPQAENILDSGNLQQEQAQGLLKKAVEQYKTDQEVISQKQVTAENAFNEANATSHIDPKRYLGQMGIGQKTLSAIGMVLSGIGAGLTGQKNMAMEVLQTNINRDIEAQQKIFANKMEAAAQARGLLQTAQDKAQINLLAQQYANIVVNSGVANAIQGTQMKVGAQVATDLAKNLTLGLQQKSLEALGNYNQNYINTYNSGDSKRLNLFGIGADAASEQLRGRGFGPIGSAGAAQRAQPHTTNPAMSTTQNGIASTPSPASPVQEAPPEGFMDKLARMFGK